MYIFDESMVRPLNPGYSLNYLKTFNSSVKLTEEEILQDLYKLEIPIYEHNYIITQMTKLPSSYYFIDGELIINCHQKFYIVESDDRIKTCENMMDENIQYGLIYDKSLRTLFQYQIGYLPKELLVYIQEDHIDFEIDYICYRIEIDDDGIYSVKSGCCNKKRTFIY